MGNGVVAVPSMPVGKTDLSLESFNSGSAVGVTAEQGSQLSSWQPLKVFVVERKGSYLENLGGEGLLGWPGETCSTIPVLPVQVCLSSGDPDCFRESLHPEGGRQVGVLEVFVFLNPVVPKWCGDAAAHVDVVRPVCTHAVPRVSSLGGSLTFYRKGGSVISLDI